MGLDIVKSGTIDEIPAAADAKAFICTFPAPSKGLWFSDGVSWSYDGPAAEPHTQGWYQGNAVNIAGGASAALTWDTLFQGDTCLTSASPGSITAPSLTSTGKWGITITVKGTALTAGKNFKVVFTMDAYNQLIQDQVSSPNADANIVDPRVHYATVLDFPTAGAPAAGPTNGAALIATVYNYDTAARDFSLELAILSRITRRS